MQMHLRWRCFEINWKCLEVCLLRPLSSPSWRVTPPSLRAIWSRHENRAIISPTPPPPPLPPFSCCWEAAGMKDGLIWRRLRGSIVVRPEDASPQILTFSLGVVKSRPPAHCCCRCCLLFAASVRSAANLAPNFLQELLPFVLTTFSTSSGWLQIAWFDSMSTHRCETPQTTCGSLTSLKVTLWVSKSAGI